jgi:hypothetical protein
VLSESEVVEHLDQAVMPLIVLLIWLHQLFQKPYLNIGIINIELFVLADLGCDHFLIRVLVVDALNNLTKGTFIDKTNYLVAIAYLLSWLKQVLSFWISYRVLVLSSYLADRVDALKHADLYLFKFSQFVGKNLQRILWAVAHLLILLPEELGVEG